MEANKTALVLEGGGFRGLFSAGVTDFLMGRKLVFPYVIGVSMGAIIGADYTAGQRGRSIAVARTFMPDKRYMGIGNFVKEGNFFSRNFAYREIPRRYILFDIKGYYESATQFYAVATDCESGAPHYFGKRDGEACEILRASSALPFISKMVAMDGGLYMDGGVADSLPLAKALGDGNEKAVVVLTREAGYRKEPYVDPRLVQLRYSAYPAFAQAIIDRHVHYNAQLAWIEELEAAGKIFVIRPPEPIETGIIDRDTAVMMESYHRGFRQMARRYGELLDYLEISAQRKTAARH